MHSEFHAQLIVRVIQFCIDFLLIEEMAPYFLAVYRAKLSLVPGDLQPCDHANLETISGQGAFYQQTTPFKFIQMTFLSMSLGSTV